MCQAWSKRTLAWSKQKDTKEWRWADFPHCVNQCYLIPCLFPFCSTVNSLGTLLHLNSLVHGKTELEGFWALPTSSLIEQMRSEHLQTLRTMFSIVWWQEWKNSNLFSYTRGFASDSLCNPGQGISLGLSLLIHVKSWLVGLWHLESGWFMPFHPILGDRAFNYRKIPFFYKFSPTVLSWPLLPKMWTKATLGSPNYKRERGRDK